MQQETILYLSRQDVEDIDLPMLSIIDALEQMFRRKARAVSRCHRSLASIRGRTPSSTPCRPTSRVWKWRV